MLAIVYLLAILVGITLGLFGGGGSIMTVPILTYVAGLPADRAIAISLFVIAVTSTVGLAVHARARRVDWRAGGVFGIAAMAGAYAGGLVSGLLAAHVLMVLFAAMMLAGAIAMLRGRTPDPRPCFPAGKALGYGALVGAASGLVGAGGGFLVVPILVVGGLAIERAIATSLLVIAMQSAAGFAGHLQHVAIDWPLALAATAMACGGMFVGAALARKVPAQTLRRGFGMFVLVMALLVLTREVILQA